MKKTILLTCALTVGYLSIYAQQNPGLDSRKSCTMIYASDGNMTLAGNNEDWTNPFPIIWFLPAEDGKFGRMFIGSQNDFEGGMNEKGLFFDGASAEDVEVPYDPKKRDYKGSLIEKATEECSSVDEVLKLFSEYNCAGKWNGQMLVGDRFGNSAIIEPLTFIRKTGKFQVVTNFLQSKTDPETSKDVRYRLASDLFKKLTLSRLTFSVTFWMMFTSKITEVHGVLPFIRISAT
ncbi:MAG: hypothetical protein V2A67_07015 [Bacteroidota bacterium]